eukprot:UN20007
MSLRNNQIPFMADEAYAAVPTFGKPKYTTKEYMLFVAEMWKKSDELKSKEFPPTTIVDCLWAHAMSLKPDKKK